MSLRTLVCAALLLGAPAAFAQSSYDRYDRSDGYARGERYDDRPDDRYDDPYNGRWNGDSWGSIAFSPDTGTYGISTDAGSRREAQARALDDCRDAGGRRCQVGPTFKNACGSVARGYRGWGSAASSNGEGAAEDRALRACDGRYDGCQIIATACSGEIY